MNLLLHNQSRNAIRLQRRLAVWGRMMLFMLVGVLTSVGALASSTFTNPVAVRGADPWVIRQGGSYFYCQSRGGSITVSKAERLVDLGRRRGSRVWTPPPGTAYSRELWAPELHYLRGQWFIYVAADDGNNDNHRMYVLQGTAQDPTQPFEFRGKIAAPTDRWAIDGTVLQMPGDRLYFVWSCWEGSNNVAQNIYIAPMRDPLTISGERICLSRPEHDWEKQGQPLVNEGPEALWNGNKLFLIYSASGSWGDDYCLGQLAWTGGDVLDPKSWVKHPKPVFAGNSKVVSPGHASFVKSRDGMEDWIVYHTARHRGAGWNRQVQIQRFTWNEDGSPHFGEPVATGVSLSVPSGD